MAARVKSPKGAVRLCGQLCFLAFLVTFAPCCVLLYSAVLYVFVWLRGPFGHKSSGLLTPATLYRSSQVTRPKRDCADYLRLKVAAYQCSCVISFENLNEVMLARNVCVKGCTVRFEVSCFVFLPSRTTSLDPSPVRRQRSRNRLKRRSPRKKLPRKSRK